MWDANPLACWSAPRAVRGHVRSSAHTGWTRAYRRGGKILDARVQRGVKFSDIVCVVDPKKCKPTTGLLDEVPRFNCRFQDAKGYGPNG